MLLFDDIAASLPNDAATWWVAYSGGIDSHVLLHLLACQGDLKPRIVAVYVNHNLQADAERWQAHCRSQAERLGVAFLSLSVDGRAKPGESPEAAARNARYRALQPLLKPDDLLVLGQHRDDQMETLLLQLFRGAGLQGLAAMPAIARFGLGRIVRPLLQVGRADIEAYAGFHGLQWITDPSNLSRDFDRNFLRHDIIPLLKQRWPALDRTVARSARHCAEAARLLESLTAAEFNQAVDTAEQTLAIDRLARLTVSESHWLIREWLRHCTGKAPSEALLQRIVSELIDARRDADPSLQFGEFRLKRYRQHLYCLPQTALQALPDTVHWPSDCRSLALPDGRSLIRYSLPRGISGMLWHNQPVSLRSRRGGEALKLPGREGRHSLKKLFQESGVPPWERNTRPLIYLGDQLAAVAGLWVAEWACNGPEENGYQIRWQSNTRENAHVDGA